MSCSWLGRAAAVTLMVAGAARGALAAGAQPAPPWTEGYTLVELEPGADLDAARRAIQSQGGTIALLLPPRSLTGWLPPDRDAALLGTAGIRRIERRAGVVAEDEPWIAATSPAERSTRAARRFFARASRGELTLAPGSASVPQALEPPGMGRPDGVHPGHISELDIAANLQRVGSPPPSKLGALSLASNSERMTGTVSVTLFCIESDGTGIDEDVYDWDEDEEDDAFDDAAAALSWWSAQASERTGCWVTFRLEAQFATQDPRCSQWREPTLHSSTEYAAAIQEVLGNFGYTVGGHLARAAAFDAAARIEHGTDWAYSVFIAANPSGPRQFTDGYAAWAYIGGPYIAMLQRNFSWTFAQVFAHETAHMFRACDEYYTPGYGGCSGCTTCADTGVENGNCEDCNQDPDTCTMRTNAWSVCEWTAGQIGWWQTPCADPPGSEIRLDAAAPGNLVQGQEVDLVLSGAGFDADTVADCGLGIDVLSYTLLSATKLQVRVRVGIDAPAGARNVVVTSTSGQHDELIQGLMVRATPRHYVAAGNTGTFPFDRPETASSDLAAALAACSTGDTLLVRGGRYGRIVIRRDVTILGGWGPLFALRVPASQPTIVDAEGLGPAVTIEGSAASPLIDGLVIRNGRADLLATPELGQESTGGALLVVDAAPLLRDCIVETSNAGTGSGGVGGGGFFWLAEPRLERCVVRGNRAGRGGGLFFLRSNATLVDVVCESNTGLGAGAGIAALASTLVIQGGKSRQNGGAAVGGGFHLQSCPSVTFDGVTIDANGATGDGGGVASFGSNLTVWSSRVTKNTAGDQGGGLYVDGGAFHLESSVVGANQATMLGGGLVVHACAASLVNVTVAENNGGPGSGLLWSNAAAAGSVRSSIIAGNALGGIIMGGGTPPVLDYNVVWGNGALDYGGVAAGAHDLTLEPRFAGPASLDFGLGLGSPALESGDPDPARNDPDGSRNDRGAHGGPRARPPAPARPLGLTARVTTVSTKLYWDTRTVTGIDHWVVYRDAAADFAPQESNRIATVDAPANQWQDPTPIEGAWYALVAVDATGHASATAYAASADHPSDTTSWPPSLVLHRIAPNPLNPDAWIDYELPVSSTLRLEIFNAAGACVRVLHTGPAPAGRRRMHWDGRDDQARPVASGVYWVRLMAGSEHRTSKLVVLR